MKLEKWRTDEGTRWSLDRHWLAQSFSLGQLLRLKADEGHLLLESLRTDLPASGEPLAPVDENHEVWAAGVTYLSSRNARQAESTEADFYARVYVADRPELFFKSPGWRAVGHRGVIRRRSDSTWDVPEPELTLVVNSHREIVGYCAGNDVSSRSIEGENPLYLPQAKTYRGSCALGPAIQLGIAADLGDLAIELEIRRGGKSLFSGTVRTSRMKRTPGELVGFLFRELEFPQGVLLMTGTGIVPPSEFTLRGGDEVRVTVGELSLINIVGD